jgi:light-regulated signal transduction histidine kinase (bacteriophytochrome)
LETIRRRKDGTELEVSAALSPIENESGKVVGIATIVRDITEMKRAERALAEAKERAEASNKELEAFSYSVSHDLRAPLRGIDGFSQALLEDQADKLDEEGEGHLARIRAGAQRMGHLIDDMIKLSQVSRSEIQRTKVDLSRIARDVADDLRQVDPNRCVEIVIKDGLAADGDPKLLSVVLGNLIDNAWKFTAKQPQARIEFGLSDPVDGRPVYFVRDNGAGFDMTYANKLFGAFQRLHSMSDFPGTGIGLATVQRVIRRHGGRVWAEGAVGEGAVFFFTL